MTNDTNLMAINLPLLKKCSRCGKDHEDVLLKQLLHPFIVKEKKTYTKFGWVVINPKNNFVEPILVTPETENFDIANQEEFTNPMVVEVEDNPRHYTFWSFCRDTFEPIFIELLMSVDEHDNE